MIFKKVFMGMLLYGMGFCCMGFILRFLGFVLLYWVFGFMGAPPLAGGRAFRSYPLKPSLCIASMRLQSCYRVMQAHESLQEPVSKIYPLQSLAQHR